MEKACKDKVWMVACHVEALVPLSLGFRAEEVIVPLKYTVALRPPTKGYSIKPLGTSNRSTRESQNVKGLRFKLRPKDRQDVGFRVEGFGA